MVDISDIKSNNKPICIFCGILITPEIDSGWEGFTEDGTTTQPVCVFCHGKDDPILLKEDYIQ